jgi:hypothetical protein
MFIKSASSKFIVVISCLWEGMELIYKKMGLKVVEKNNLREVNK